jgi:hypothetical protein
MLGMLSGVLADVSRLRAEEPHPGPFARLYDAGAATFAVDQMFGGDIEDEESYLYLPVDMTLDADGNLYVLDAKEKVIKKFDADGHHLLTFSRPGQGPGDLDRPNSINGTPEGTLLVYDGSLRRFSRFSPDGRFLDSREFHEMGSHRIWNVRVDTHGHILAAINVQDSQKPEAPIPFRLCRLTLDPYHETRIDSAAVAKTVTVTIGDATMYTSKPAAPGFHWSLTPRDGIVVGTSIDGVLRLHDPDLQHTTRHQVQTSPQVYSDEDKRAYLAQFEDSPYADLVRRKVEFPEHHPYFHRLFVDDEGFILLQVRQVEDGEALVEVRNPDGSYRTTITLPSLSRTAILKDGMLYTVQLHEDADYAVFRYRPRF